eukprot:TRINITY_DN6039_c1_g1_i1.p1 TRINITY_DN6039_c1_g1~~TRINITY_DN6039_c1_g1_i1.p1  ORF type:complete len:260 (-),score=75.64 TRINITY_DN6039_c1_g1_i1:23-802(-)
MEKIGDGSTTLISNTHHQTQPQNTRKKLPIKVGFVANANYVYMGEFRGGERSGFGVCFMLQSNNNFSKGSVYVGEFQDDEPHGKGKQYSATGLYCVAEWQKAKKNGFSYSVWPTGVRYDGPNLDNQREGKGKCWFANGDYFEGIYKKNKRNGPGCYYFANGSKYDGNFVNNVRKDYGVFEWKNGSKYTGHFGSGKKHGHGTLYMADENVTAVGTFNDEKFKEGKITMPNGKVISSPFPANLPILTVIEKKYFAHSKKQQ